MSENPSDALYITPAMAAIWSAEAHVRGMLAFEGALAQAESRAGIISARAAKAIRAASRVEAFDVAALYREAVLAGSPAIPLVRMLTERVEESARGYVHWGATSQDVIDTALVLQMREGLDLLRARLLATGKLCAALAGRHRATPMAGRTLLQQALPITFGLKAARWLALMTRQAQRVAEVRARISVVQLGGAAGTLASLGVAGPHVTTALAAELGLSVPDLPWHTERDRVAEVAAALAVLSGSMAKIAHDLSLLSQSEVGEVAEAAGPDKGGSSAMPQKRNPVNAMLAQAAARLALGVAPVILGALPQEHERAVGGWQAEWEALPQLFRYTAGAVERTHDALDGLEVNAAAMRANLDRSHGLIMAEALTMALAPRVGRPEAFRLTREATEQARMSGAELLQVALDDTQISARLSAAAITQTLDPMAYLGSANVYIDRALEEFRALVAAG